MCCVGKIKALEKKIDIGDNRDLQAQLRVRRGDMCRQLSAAQRDAKRKYYDRMASGIELDNDTARLRLNVVWLDPSARVVTKKIVSRFSIQETSVAWEQVFSPPSDLRYTSLWRPTMGRERDRSPTCHSIRREDYATADPSSRGSHCRLHDEEQQGSRSRWVLSMKHGDCCCPHPGNTCTRGTGCYSQPPLTSTSFASPTPGRPVAKA